MVSDAFGLVGAVPVSSTQSLIHVLAIPDAQKNVGIWHCYEITILVLFSWHSCDLCGYRDSGRGVDSTAAANPAVMLAVYIPTHVERIIAIPVHTL